ncbi:hypothetical protein [Chlorella virus XW01]|nr:hypothetical protein [Chlorella virus XW01]
MDILSDTVNTATESMNFVLKPFVEQQSIFTFVSLFLILYASLAKPKLPIIIRQLFDNAVFRFIVLTLILWRGNKDIKSSLIMAIGFVLTMQIVNKQKTDDIINNIIYKQYNKVDNFTNTNDKIIPDYNFNCEQYGLLMSELDLKKTEAQVKCLTEDERIKILENELNKTEDQLKGPIRCERNLIECNKNKGKECGIEYIACINSINSINSIK